MEASTKKKILIAIAATAGFLLLAALGVFLYYLAQFSVYQDDQYKFSIKYPKGWKEIIHPKETVAVVFLRPKDTSFDTVQENFNVTVQEVPADIFNLAAFSAKIKAQMTAVFGQSINIVEDKDIKWGWREGHQMIIEAPKPDNLVMVNAWVISGGQAYILTFLGDISKYPHDSILINEMIRSLQLQ